MSPRGFVCSKTVEKKDLKTIDAAVRAKSSKMSLKFPSIEDSVNMLNQSITSNT